MGIDYNPRTITDGLVLCLDAANTKSYPGSGTAWTDLSGSGYTGTLTNGVGYSASNGGALSFDGTNDYVDLDNFVPTLNGLTYSTECYWFKLSSAQNDGTAFALSFDGDAYNAVGNFTSGSSNESISISKSNITAYYENGNGFYYDNTWHNACYVYGAGFNKLYVDANELSLRYSIGNSSTTRAAYAASRFLLGNRTTDYYFSAGNIAQVSIYNRALTAAEISQNFNALRGRFGI